jgi:hypothetical protein
MYSWLMARKKTRVELAMTAGKVEFGLDSFGEVSAEPSGRLLSAAEAVRMSTGQLRPNSVAAR